MTIRNGACLCGAVHYTLATDPVAVRVCWCRDCQRLAANGTVNMIVPVDALEVGGTLGEFVSQADSGNQMRRRFCPRCGTHLFSHSSGRPQFVAVRVGTLDDPSSVRPNTDHLDAERARLGLLRSTARTVRPTAAAARAAADWLSAEATPSANALAVRAGARSAATTAPAPARRQNVAPGS